MPAEKKTLVRSVSLSEIRPVAERLNSVSDELNAALKEIEARIVALNAGLEVFVDLRPERAHFVDEHTAMDGGVPSGFYWTQQRLGLARMSTGEWSLVVTHKESTEHSQQRAEGPETKTPLLQASREDRLASVAKIPELLAAIHDKASAAIERIERARALADSLS
jgi:hypothetical protein